MSTKPKARQQANAAQLPLGGTHVVEKADGKSETFRDSFYQIGTEAELPGVLSVFHMSGAYPLATFAAGHWISIVRQESSGSNGAAVTNNLIQVPAAVPAPEAEPAP